MHIPFTRKPVGPAQRPRLFYRRVWPWLRVVMWFYVHPNLNFYTSSKQHAQWNACRFCSRAVGASVVRNASSGPLFRCFAGFSAAILADRPAK